MLPIGDDNWDRRRRPVVTVLLVAVNVLVFFYELHLAALGRPAIQGFISRWGVVPLEYARQVDLPPAAPGPFWATLFTSMFIHGGWGHLLGNMLYLWIFGDNVEDRLGRLGFLGFYLATGVAGALAQVAAAPGALVPTVGASGAISGVLGAYLVMFPRKRVRVLLFLFVLDVPALVVIGLWAFTQLASGVGSLAAPHPAGGVAYLAHVGGFAAGVAGALVARVWTRSRLRARGPRPRSRP